MFNAYNVQVLPKLLRYQHYYDGIQAILNKAYSDDTKPCNRVVTNYCKNIADTYVGYLAAPGCITYTSNDDISEILEILRYNDVASEDADFLLDALVYGVAAELMFIDGEGKTRFRLIKPTQCFGVYDDSLTNDLLYFCRFYKANEWSEDDVYNVDVYSNFDVKHYTMTGMNGYLTYTGQERHYFSDVPANILHMPEDKSIFDCVVGLQDAVNTLISAEIDDYEAFCDAYLALTGVDAEAEDIAAMKENRVLLLPEGAQAAWLTKNANDTQIENMLKRLHDNIYRIAQMPDFSSESFVGGVSSGIAIRYRLTGMETRAAKIAAEMKKALQRRVEIICGIASLKIGEEVFRDIQINFVRNVPTDLGVIINTVNGLQGIVSDKTLLSQIPFVSDVDAEVEAVQEQKQNNVAMYSFGNATRGVEDGE